MNLRFTIYDLRFARAAEAAPCFSSIVRRKSSIVNAFTLIELMMVVAIIGLIMATGVPAILSITHEAPLRKAVNDMMEICSHARAQAILGGQTTTIVFHPRVRQVALSGGAGCARASRASHARGPGGGERDGIRPRRGDRGAGHQQF